MAGRKNEYVGEVRANVRAWLAATNNLRSMQPEATALNYVSTLTPADLEGSLADVAPADVIAVVFTTVDALDAFLEQGHGTNLHKLL